MYDYLIVGCGLFGSVFARQMTDCGKKCLIIDKRNHTGGNVYDEKIEDILVHKYGPHIFHTSDENIWNYVNKFTKFNNFIYEPIANYNGDLYNLPFNMNTFRQMWNIKTPKEAIEKIKSQLIYNNKPKNIEEFALSNIGKDIYDKLIYGYTFKQWNKEPKELPVSIIKRIPIRYTFNNNYFDDKYQGIPIEGYTKLIEKLNEGIEIRLNIDFLLNKEYFESISNKIVYTGKIDEFFNYEFGFLGYRSLKFENELIENIDNFQGVAGMNFTSKLIPYTRIIEHKHFLFNKGKHTIITKEYPENHNLKNEPYYPINDEINNKKYNLYKQKLEQLKNYIFGGRLAEYKYYDMHQIIGSALNKSKKENE